MGFVMPVTVDVAFPHSVFAVPSSMLIYPELDLTSALSLNFSFNCHYKGAGCELYTRFYVREHSG